MSLEPSQRLEGTIRIVQQVFRICKTPYWLSFGGLWGLIKNRGIVPDDDLDLCCFYGADWKRIEKCMASYGYTLNRGLKSDTEPENLLYCHFNSTNGNVSICLSFWYLNDGIRYYCHDQNHEISSGVAVPPSGYFFKGIPADIINSEADLRLVEWPGIEGCYKISVPHRPGVILDYTYPDWAYIKQRYVVGKKHEVKEEKCVSIWKHGACSPYQFWVKSMAQFSDKDYIDKQIVESKKDYYKILKKVDLIK